MSTKTVSKFVTFVIWKSCVRLLRLQNICRLNRRSYLPLSDLKGKCRRFARVTTNGSDSFDRHDHRAGRSGLLYYRTNWQWFILRWANIMTLNSCAVGMRMAIRSSHFHILINLVTTNCFTYYIDMSWSFLECIQFAFSLLYSYLFRRQSVSSCLHCSCELIDKFVLWSIVGVGTG